MITPPDISGLVHTIRQCARHYRWRGEQAPRDLEEEFEVRERFDEDLLEYVNGFLGEDYAIAPHLWARLLEAQQRWSRREDIDGPGRSLMVALMWRDEHLAVEACAVVLEALLPEKFPSPQAEPGRRRRYRAVFGATLTVRACCSRRFPILAVPEDLLRPGRVWHTRKDVIDAYRQQVCDVRDLADRLGLASPAKLDDGLYQWTKCLTDGCALGDDCPALEAGVPWAGDRLDLIKTLNRQFGAIVVQRAAQADVLRLMRGLMPSDHAIRESLRTLAQLPERTEDSGGLLEALDREQCEKLANLWERDQRGSSTGRISPRRSRQLQLLRERVHQRPARFAQGLSDMLECRLVSVAGQIADEQTEAARRLEEDALARREDLHDVVAGDSATASGKLHSTGRSPRTSRRAPSESALETAVGDTRAFVRRVGGQSEYAALVKALTSGR